MRSGSKQDYVEVHSSSRCQVNFKVYYEVDDEEVPTALGLEEYGREDEFGWVLLEAAAVGPA